MTRSVLLATKIVYFLVVVLRTCLLQLVRDGLDIMMAFGPLFREFRVG
jgi:hypothetical protein